MPVKQLGNPLGNPLANPPAGGGGEAPVWKQVNEQIDTFQYHLQYGSSGGKNIPTGTNWDGMTVVGRTLYDYCSVAGTSLQLRPHSLQPGNEMGFMMPRDRSLPDSGTTTLNFEAIGFAWVGGGFGTLNYRKNRQVFNFSGKDLTMRNQAYEGSDVVLYGRVIWRAYDNDIRYNAGGVFLSTTSVSWDDVFGKDYKHGYLFKGVQHYSDGQCSTWFSRGVPKTLTNQRQWNQHGTFNLVFDGDNFVTSATGTNYQYFAYNLTE
jgi:hypothetical protein